MLVFKASAPGSLMLLGEHAVLLNHAALVCAVDQRISVQLTVRNDKKIVIHSVLGHYETDIQHLDVASPFQFVLTTLKKFQKRLKQGCTISIKSEFSDQVGLASSAAVTVATLFVLSDWLDLHYSAEQLIRKAREIVQMVQGMGSGADVAACVLGGVIAYRMHPLMMKKIENNPPLTVIYSGSKTKTTKVLAHVNAAFAPYPDLFKKIMRAIGESAEQGIEAAIKKDWQSLGRIMNIHQGLHEALLVSTPLLNGLIEELRASPAMYGAKISGSGLGDCVIGLGSFSHFTSKYPDALQLPVNITKEGVRSEKI